MSRRPAADSTDGTETKAGPQWPNRNMMWAEILVDELVRCGVRHAVLSPGSRSAPLALALKRHPGIKLHVIVDERSAGYFAVGLAKSPKPAGPVLLVCTSGTAAPNYYPAVIEAHQSGASLIVVTCDRPGELRDSGANQTIDQRGIFGSAVRWSGETLLPEPTPEALRHLRHTASRAAAFAWDPPGPVQLNVPLREPLAPMPDAADRDAFVSMARAREVHGRSIDGRPTAWTKVAPAWRRPHPYAVERWQNILKGARGVVVAGPCQGRTRGSPLLDATELAQKLGVPMLKDGLSGGSRWAVGSGALRVGMSQVDLILASAKARAFLEPDWIVQFGATPTSKHLRAYLAEHVDAPRLVVDELGKLWDEHQGADIMPAHAREVVRELLTHEDRGVGAAPPPQRGSDAAWAGRWQEVARRVGVDDAEKDWEGPVPDVLVSALEGVRFPMTGLLWVGSSLPVRDVDRYASFASPQAPPILADIDVCANRGASGIDGVLSSAAGAASVTEGRCIAYVGDLTFLHDLNGLAAVKKYAPHLTIVVLNNGGGRIFEHLPIADSIPRAEFEELFLTPQDVDIGKATEAFGLKHVRLQGTSKLAATLKEMNGGVIEVVVDGNVAVKRRKDHLAKVVAAVDKLVDQWEKEDQGKGKPSTDSLGSAGGGNAKKSAQSAKSVDNVRNGQPRKRQGKAKVRK